jgi:hypothetical protein
MIMKNGSEHYSKYSSIILGDNCTPYLMEIAREKDVTVVLEHPLGFPENMADKVYFRDIDVYADNYEDFLFTMLKNHSTPWGGVAGI